MNLTYLIRDYFIKFKNEIPQIDEIINTNNELNDLYSLVVGDEFTKTIQENILLIYGYSFRLENLDQRLFYTFSEAVNSINLDNLMKNEDSLKLNCYVYLSVIKFILDEYNKQEDKELINKAILRYKSVEEQRSKENRYHVYQS